LTGDGGKGFRETNRFQYQLRPFQIPEEEQVCTAQAIT
jgi:hypothetical protein